jgi:hypothetical protein
MQMPNRAERRAQARQSRNGVPQPNQPNNRGRGGLVDEYSLQERSRRLAESGDVEWKPRAETVIAEKGEDDKPIRPPHSVRQWFRVLTWLLIVASAIAFAVLMWIPKRPMWVIIAVCAAFVVGVLSLFFTAGDYRHNPNLDDNGTAV